MPTVPRTQRQVGTAPLSGARVLTDALPSTFGAPVDMAPATGIVAQLQARERLHADQVANNQNELRAAALKTKVLYDPEQGALNLKGTNALGALAKARAAWAQGVFEIESEIRDPRQKEMFQLRSAEHWNDVLGAVERHAHAEFTAEDARTTEALSSNADDQAVQNASDAEKVADAIAKKRAIWADYAKRQGWSAEAVAAKLTQEVSAVHMGVLEHLLNSEQDLAASAYLAKNREQIASKDLLLAERLTDAGSVRAESQRVSDGIIAKTSTLSAALEDVRAIQDPRIRDAVETRVRRTFLDRAADDRQERAIAFQQASEILERTRNFNKIPISVRVKLTPEENGALQRREEQIRHPKRTTVPELYNSLLNAAGLNDTTREWFRNAPLGAYRNQLSEEDFNRLTSLQLSARLEESRGVAGEAKHEARAEAMAARKAAAAAEKHAEALKTLEAMGVPLGPTVPGAPLPKPAPSSATASGHVAKPLVPSAADTSGQRVPQAWLDHAARDPNYKKYLQHMGVQIP